MFPSKQPPKKGHRVGGAPFSSPRRNVPGQAMSARAPPKPSGASAPAPLSARQAGQSQNAGPRPTTPCTGKAKEYYSKLLGAPLAQNKRLEAGQPVTSSEKVRHDWTLVHEIDALDHFNREETKKHAEKQKNMNYQASLQEQLQKKQHVTEKCRDVWKQWRTELEDDVVQFQQEEESKRVYVLEAQKRFNQERQHQLAENKQRKILQKEKDKQMERRMLEMAEEAKTRQDVLDQEKKQKQRNDMLYMREESQNAAQRKRTAKEAEKLDDIKKQKEYEELLDEQESRRGQYFVSIREKQAKMLAKYEQGVGNELARLAAIDDERARKQQESKEQKERLDLEDREKWRRNLAESGRLAVENQLSLQAQERQRRREEDQRYSERLRKEAVLADEKESDKVRRKKEAVLANAEHVRKQIEDKEAYSPTKKAGQAQMNDVERQINREKLDRATDPSRADGLQSLLGKKRAEYRKMNLHGNKPVALPC